MDITITLNQDEIIDAIKMKLAQDDIVTKNKEIEFNFVAGRGINGASAVLTVKGNLPLIDAVLASAPAGDASAKPAVKKADPVVETPAPKDIFTDTPVVKETSKPKKETAPVADPFAEEEKAEAAAKAIADAAVAKATEEAEEPSLFGETTPETVAADNVEEEESLFSA